MGVNELEWESGIFSFGVEIRCRCRADVFSTPLSQICYNSFRDNAANIFL